MSIALILVVHFMAAPAPAPEANGWTGQMVMVSRANVTGTSTTRGDESVTRLRSMDYYVIKDTGTDVVLSENGKELLVAKENLVLMAEAVGHYTQVIENDAMNSNAYARRGSAYKFQKNLDKALDDYNKAVELNPRASAWRNNRALIWIEKKEYDKAMTDYDEAIKLSPSPLSFVNRGRCWWKKKDYDSALKDFQKAIELEPSYMSAHNTLAALLATCPEAKFRDGKQAVLEGTRACEICDWKIGSVLDTLASAYAELGQFDEAIKYQERAFADPNFLRDKERVDAARKRLAGYRNKKAYRDDGE